MATKARDTLLVLLKAASEIYPEMRIGQLLDNCRPPDDETDPFYITDEKYVEYLTNYIRSYNG